MSLSAKQLFDKLPDDFLITDNGVDVRFLQFNEELFEDADLTEKIRKSLTPEQLAIVHNDRTVSIQLLTQLDPLSSDFAKRYYTLQGRIQLATWLLKTN